MQGRCIIQTKEYHYPNFPLRLYALKIRENIVVLFNGGVKDNTTNQSSSLSMQWHEACMFAKRIDQAIAEGDIIVNELKKELTWYNGSKEIIL